MPSPTGLVVKNGSKTRSRISGAIPVPVSRNSTSSRSWWSAVRTVSVPSPPASLTAATALSIRLVHTWFSSAGYAGTRGTVRSYSLTTSIRGPIFPESISRVLSRSSWTSTVRCGARSSCAYCLAASTRCEIRAVESAISFISSSVSTVS
ncbi:hypothetical protein SVIOM342S_05562 [Streptomyces violaceorubidus]